MEALFADLVELGGAGMVWVSLEAGEAIPEPACAGVVRVGVHRRGPLPTEGLEPFDILLSAQADAPRPWVGLPGEALDSTLEALAATVARQPAAAAVAAQALRMSLSLSFEQALIVESLGYSMLLASKGLLDWRAATPRGRRLEPDVSRVLVERRDGVIDIRMNRPQARNAVDAAMRDALNEAFDFAIHDPEAAPVVLSGAGPSFCSGGDLDEFGQTRDPGAAHLIRVLRAPVRLVRQIRERVTARVHGACIGAGIEIPAAAGRVTARAGAYFRLPEVAMGLIPGAGGTASIPRRIGRRRACYMAISGRDIDAPTALAWGLVDAVEAGG
jgi:enoyl-CoA hydratase/carnithine racemase